MEEQVRAQLVRFSHRVYEKGWVANHDGNLSARVGDKRFVCTPTAVSKGCVSAELLLAVDLEGNRLEGTRKVFSEWKLHKAAYQARPDVGAVCHAHPPTATGFAVAGVDLGPAFMAEPVVSLGDRVPTVPYRMPGHPEEATLLAQALAEADAVFLAGHGVLTVGPDLETCFLRMELVEHLCRIALVACQMGGIRPIPPADVSALLEKRAAAGLGSRTGVRAEAPAMSASAAPFAGPDASIVVAEALRRLGGS